MPDFKKEVYHRLVDLDKGPGWLIEKVKEKTGLYCDHSLLKRIFEGSVAGKKIRAAICEILDIDGATLNDSKAAIEEDKE